jgi:hypothetical protein
MTPDDNQAVKCLHQNLLNLSDGAGNVPVENQALWNISNTLLVVLDALRVIQAQSKI